MRVIKGEFFLSASLLAIALLTFSAGFADTHAAKAEEAPKQEKVTEEGVAPVVEAEDVIIDLGEEKAEEEFDPCPWIAIESTMKRSEDFIVIPGRKIKRNLNHKISSLALIASKDGEIKPVPFQVDEINAEGDWVLPEKSPYLKVDDVVFVNEQDEDKGRLDQNDELVFMVRDSGDRIKKKYLPKEAAYIDEIMLVDNESMGRSWVYLCSYMKDPPMSDKDYINYVFPENHIVTDDFELGFSLKVPITWDYMSFLGEPNMIDRMKLRFHIKLFGIDSLFHEESYHSKLSLFKDGPVRVIRHIRSSIQLNKYFKSPSAASESIYYNNAVVIPFRIKIPVSPKLFSSFLNIKVRGGVDMQNLHGWKLRTDADPRWLNIDGKMDETENSIKGEGATYFILKGPPGALLNRMVLDRTPDGSKQTLPIKSDFFFVDDDTTDDPPEFVPGQSPNIGYWMDGFEQMPRGVFYFYLINYMIKDYEEGMEEEWIKIMDQPLEAFIR